MDLAAFAIFWGFPFCETGYPSPGWPHTCSSFPASTFQGHLVTGGCTERGSFHGSWAHQLVPDCTCLSVGVGLRRTWSLPGFTLSLILTECCPTEARGDMGQAVRNNQPEEKCGGGSQAIGVQVLGAVWQRPGKMTGTQGIPNKSQRPRLCWMLWSAWAWVPVS